MTAVIERLGSDVDAIDLFCGYGGSSQGIHKAGANVKVAANHDKLAIDCHAANYPEVDHWRADLGDPTRADYVDPVNLPKARFLWASPSCKFHSPANAAKLYAQGPQGLLFDDDEFDHVAYANSERSRVTMVCPLRYAAKHRPELVVIENVVEAAKWGPGRDGSTFRWWLDEWEKLGYRYECLFLNSAFFPPCPQSRDRMYVVFWKRGNRAPDLDYRPIAVCTSDTCQGAVVRARQAWKERTAAWPLPRWGKYGAQYTYACPDCNRDVEPTAWPAYTAIDWSNLGPTVGDRMGGGAKGLADSTLDRIRRGLGKFRNGPPIVIPAKAVWGTDRSVVDPFSTQTTQQDKALIGHGFMVKNNGSIDEAKYRALSLGEPLGAVTSSPAAALATHGVMMPVHGNCYERPGQVRARELHDPAFTLAATQGFGFAHIPNLIEMRGGGSVAAGQHAVTDEAHTVTAGGFHHGLVTPAIWTKFNGGPTDTAWHHMNDPLGTITGRDTTGLVILPWIDQYCSDPIAVTEQLATVMTHLRHSLASVEVQEMDTITDEELAKVRFRMLEPDPELRRTMAFDEHYTLLGNKTQMTSGLGNAVTPPVATWITEQAMATLDEEGARRVAA